MTLCKLWDKKWLQMILVNGNGPTGKGNEGYEQQATTIRWSMLLMECSWLNETPDMQCNKRNLITDGGMKIPTLTLAPMGMVAPWRCQELQLSGKVGSAFIHWVMESKTQAKMHDWKLMTLTTQIDSHSTKNWLDT